MGEHQGFGGARSSSVAHGEWNRRYREHGAESVWTRGPNRFLVQEVGGLEPGTALDLACGTGRNAVWLAAHGWDVTGVDFSEVALVSARRLASARGVDVQWVLADVLDYDVDTQAFDLVTVLYLQLPSREQRHVLALARDAVVPGGTLLVLAHDLLNLTQGFGGPSNPVVLYTPNDIAHEVQPLVVERAERVFRRVGAGRQTHTAIDALVKARRLKPE